MAAMMMIGGRHGRGGAGPWEWDGGDDTRSHGGPRRGPRGRMFASGELRLVLLRLIADQPRHGYELIKAIETLTGGRYAPSPGVVYPTLSLLLDEGAVEEVAADAPRKAFVATAAGRTELDQRADDCERLLERLRSLDEAEHPRRPPPIARAVANLFAALRDRAAAGEFDKETIHAVADILDDAARRIERL
ncbi:MAG: PadR family transcriptional regulator [Novosphingobium sp.]